MKKKTEWPDFVPQELRDIADAQIEAEGQAYEAFLRKSVRAIKEKNAAEPESTNPDLPER